MKIGILTFHRSQNYGALLQAKALQDYLKILGYDVSFIDYWPKYHEDMYKPFSFEKWLKLKFPNKIYTLIKLIFTYHRLVKRRAKTKEYCNKFLNISKATNYDVVIYGSDQIWRKQHQPSFAYYNPVYFGNDYVDTDNKIAYAASMGKIEIDNIEDRQFIKKHLANFNAISIREQDLIERLSQEFGIKYQHVCDPVFLLSRSQWEKHVDKKYIPHEKYILYYRLQPLKETDRMVDELVRQTGYRVIEMRSYIPFLKYGDRYNFTADAQEFVSLICGAEYVVTSAFHGIAMSIIFERQFFFASQKKQANRVVYLFLIIFFNKRFSDGRLTRIDTTDIIDYDNVNLKLDEFRETSRQWLQKELNKCEQRIS